LPIPGQLDISRFAVAAGLCLLALSTGAAAPSSASPPTPAGSRLLACG
jgi:hypothetical protein